MTPTRIAAIAALLLSPLTPAQLLRGGDVVVTDSTSLAVLRIDSAGVVTPIPTGGLVTGPSGIVADRDGSVVVCDTASGALVRIDAQGTTSQITAGLRGPLRVTLDLDGTYLVTQDGSRSIARVFRGGGGTGSFLAQGTAGIVRPYDVVADGTGGYVVSDDLGAGVYRVSQRGNVTPLHVGAPFQAPQGVALFPNGDFAVFDAGTDMIYRIARGTGQLSVWIPPAGLAGNPTGICETHDGGFLMTQNGIGANRVLLVEASQNVLPFSASASFANLADVALIPQLQGPRDFTTGPGSATALALDLPAQPGRVYVMGLAGSLFPGLPLPNGDPRALTLTADGLLLATFATNLPPILTGWLGVTDPSGRATPGVDFSLLPPGFLAGTTFQAQALTLRPGAPNGIETITNPLSMTFQ